MKLWTVEIQTDEGWDCYTQTLREDHAAVRAQEQADFREQWTRYGREGKHHRTMVKPTNGLLRASQPAILDSERLLGSRLTAEMATRSTRRIDGGQSSIEDSPLFGGERQGELL